jgi:hypothetical protein
MLLEKENNTAKADGSVISYRCQGGEKGDCHTVGLDVDEIGKKRPREQE